MKKLNIELCPETGICSIIKKDGTKVDLMPDEVTNLRDSLSNPESVRKVIAEADSGFAQALAPEELAELSAELKPGAAKKT
jgi:hypothetical protein